MCPAFTVLLRADAPFPVVLGYIAATWPTEARGMQFLHGLQDVGTESTQILTRLRGHSNHVYLNRATFHGYGKIAIDTNQRLECELIFFPLLAYFAK